MDLELKDVSISIGKKNIVEDICLKVADNSFVALLGPNGSGKSTLLKSVYRVLSYEKGIILLDNNSMKDVASRYIAKNMSVVSQFQNNNFDFSVLEVVLMGRTPHLKSMEREREKDFKIVEEALFKTGMYSYKERLISSLSGGELQRVVLARAIAQDPSLMILDEPSNHLDIKYQLEILAILKELNLNVLTALHDVSLAAQFCDYIYFIKDGKINFHGKAEDVINKENIKYIYGVDCEIDRNIKTGNLNISYYKPKLRRNYE